MDLKIPYSFESCGFCEFWGCGDRIEDEIENTKVGKGMGEVSTMRYSKLVAEKNGKIRVRIKPV
jgi:hypothetical protein